jgi:hypothetical protein
MAAAMMRAPLPSTIVTTITITPLLSGAISDQWRDISHHSADNAPLSEPEGSA